jgi:ribonuclease P protein component
VVVSTKVSKKAPKRNRLKRIIRELIRKKLPTLPYGDYVLALKPQAGQAEEAKLLGNLQASLEKV